MIIDIELFPIVWVTCLLVLSYLSRPSMVGGQTLLHAVTMSRNKIEISIFGHEVDQTAYKTL